VCWVLYRMARKPQPGWYVWGWFMVLAGVERFLIEFIRRNPVVFAGLRTTQLESIASVVIGVAIILLVRDREPVEASFGPARAPAGGDSGGGSRGSGASRPASSRPHSQKPAGKTTGSRRVHS
jgi:Prolipoprotein diacylglyceryl transferase